MKTSLAFTGDIGFDHYMDRKWEDKNLLSPKILDFLNGADHVIANVEGALVDRKNIITDGVNAVDATMLHSIDPAAAKVLLNIKADIWNIANNHIMDAGPAGVSATLDIAKKCGAKTIGAGMNIEEAARPLFLKEAGGIGMFAVGYRRGCKPADNDKAGCLSWNDMERIRNNIDEIKKTCRWCIIVSHGGEEFTSLPSPYTRDRYLKYLDMGADPYFNSYP